MLEIHPFANLMAIASAINRMDLLFIGRAVGTVPWCLYHAWWTDPGGWAPGNSQVAGGPFPAAIADGLEPLSAIAVCARDGNTVDAFVVGTDGLLYATSLARAANTWTALVAIATPHPPGSSLPASIDAACSDGAGSIQLIVSGRDGQAYWTSRTPVAPNFPPLQRVVPLNL